MPIRRVSWADQGQQLPVAWHHVIGAIVLFMVDCLLCWTWKWLGEVRLRTAAGCHYCLAWSYLAIGTEHSETRYCLLRVCGPLRDFRKVCRVNQSRLLVWRSLWRKLRLNEKAVWREIS